MVFGNFSKIIFEKNDILRKKFSKKMFFEKFQENFQKFFKKCQECLCGPPDKISGSIVMGGKGPFPPSRLENVNSEPFYLRNMHKDRPL